MLCFIDGETARLVTRRGNDWTQRFPSLARAASMLPVHQAILDGEVVVIDEQGYTDFQALQNMMRGKGSGTLIYYIFDLPHCEGYDLSAVALENRKRFLRRLLPDEEEGALRYSDHIRGKGESVYQHACRFALEGIICKKADSHYQQQRTSTWRKVKCTHRQEFVIGGYTEPQRSRIGFGALLLGTYDEQGHLQYRGKVGTGFSDQVLGALYRQLRALERKTPPFSRRPSRAEARKIHWVEPELVAMIEFLAWTEDGRLRAPSFKGLREDKPPEQVGREATAPPIQESRPQKLRRGGRSITGESEVAGVRLTNPDRILYPDLGLSKRELAHFFQRIREWIVPHLAGRPLTLVRCPQGYTEECFFQKHFEQSLPDFVRAVTIAEKDGTEENYIVVEDVAGIVSLVQMGALEFHPWGSREDRLEQPDLMIFDLDPAPDVPWDETIKSARLLHELLAELDLRCFVKTSGGKGLHLVVPLMRRTGWDDLRAFAERVAVQMVQREPQRFVATMSKARRGGKIFIDYFRNNRGSTSIAAFSTRAKPGAPVSTPLSWSELSVRRGPAYYTVENLPRRLARLKSDPWEDFFTVRQSLSEERKKRLGV